MSKVSLAPHQQQTMELLEQGKSFDEIDQIIGGQEGNARIYYRSALRALEEIGPGELLKRFPNVALSRDETEEDALDQETMQAAKSAGLPEGILKQVNKRIAAKTGKLTRAASKKLFDRDVASLLDEKLYLALKYLDDFSLSGASAKDLAGVVDLLIKNSQLLRGRPTQILDDRRRKKLNELVPALLLEAQRRGLEIPFLDAEFVRVNESP